MVYTIKCARCKEPLRADDPDKGIRHGVYCNRNRFNFNDGGRAEAGFTGTAGDCTVRAIAIATQQSYGKVYEELFELNRKFNRKGKTSPRDGGTKMTTIKKYMDSLGWKWTPTMSIGSGCKVHLKADELPTGRVMVRTSRHISTIIDGVINDTYDPSRGGTRCVYGYWTK